MIEDWTDSTAAYAIRIVMWNMVLEYGALAVLFPRGQGYVVHYLC